MAKLSLSLDERTTKNGMQQIRLRVTNKGTNAFAGTGVWVEPQYFAKYSLYDPIRGKAYMAAEKREQVRLFVKRFEDFMASVSREELDGLMASEIKTAALGTTKGPQGSSDNVASSYIIKSGGQYDIRRSSGDFLSWYDAYGASRRTAKTQESYAYGLKVLRAYCEARRMRSLGFGDIDYARLSDFANWLHTTGRSEATRHMLESYVRAAYKEAQKRRMVSRENDPYFDYSIKQVPRKEIDCLTGKEMNTLMMADLPTKGMQRARDIAMASFYLCGANLLDLYEMDTPKRGDVVFVRHKVENKDQMPLHIRIEPELRALLDAYGGDAHLFNFKASYANYDSFRHKIYHRLQEVSTVVGFMVTMAKVRRTWATIAGELEVPESVIDKSMGHVDKTITQLHYKKYDWGLTAKANRRVIDHVLAQNGTL